MKSTSTIQQCTPSTNQDIPTVWHSPTPESRVLRCLQSPHVQVNPVRPGGHFLFNGQRTGLVRPMSRRYSPPTLMTTEEVARRTTPTARGHKGWPWGWTGLNYSRAHSEIRTAHTHGAKNVSHYAELVVFVLRLWPGRDIDKTLKWTCLADDSCAIVFDVTWCLILRDT